jgi:hypothetical protein
VAAAAGVAACPLVSPLPSEGRGMAAGGVACIGFVGRGALCGAVAASGAGSEVRSGKRADQGKKASA